MMAGKPHVDSVWTRPERAPRGPVPEHSRAKIAAAGILIADADGLGAVTMRSVAAAVGTGPASLYRYVVNRGELVELMADQARGELDYTTAAGGPPAARLLAIAREGRALYLRHPWLLDVQAAPVPGPNAVMFIEHTLAALDGTDRPGWKPSASSPERSGSPPRPRSSSCGPVRMPSAGSANWPLTWAESCPRASTRTSPLRSPRLPLPAARRASRTRSAAP
jgi:AcrR family transcriptional regulator